MTRDEAAQDRYEAARARLGAFIRSQREDQGLSQRDFAEKVAMPQTTISRLESGKKVEGNPSHALGLKEQYPNAPLDPEDRMAYFESRNPQMPSMDAAVTKRGDRGR